MVYRQPYLSLRIEHAAQIAPSNRKVRSCLDRLQVAGLGKQNVIYSGLIRELKGTRAARYARPPIVAPQLLSLSLFHTRSPFPSFFFSPFILLSLISKEKEHILPLYITSVSVPHHVSPFYLQTLDSFDVPLELPESLHDFLRSDNCVCEIIFQVLGSY